LDLEFEWWRPERPGGYRWDDAGALARAADSTRLVPYKPLREDSALFLNLAATPRTREGVLAAADAHGKLESIHDRHSPSETLARWSERLDDLEDLATLYVAYRDNDEAVLAARAVRSETGVQYRYARAGRPPQPEALPDPGGGPLCAPDFFFIPNTDYPSMLTGDRDNPREAAFVFLAGRLDVRLPYFVWPRLVVDPGRPGRYVFGEWPRSLIGAAWLQLARAVAGEKDYRTCVVCGRWFEVSPAVNRIDRSTCSNACRQRQYRQRKERARELARKGKSVRLIAAELDTDMKTVRGWVKGA
jgi:hypothetical protein